MVVNLGGVAVRTAHAVFHVVVAFSLFVAAMFLVMEIRHYYLGGLSNYTVSVCVF